MKPSSLDSNIIYLCGQFSHRFSQLLNTAFRNNGINVTTEQFSLLALLWYKDGISQREISENLDRDKTTVARVIMNMQKNKLIKQETDSSDKRSKLIYLTQKGKGLQQTTINISGALYMRVMNNIPALKIKSGVELLQNMLGNL